MRLLPPLIEITPEGRIVTALIQASKGYSELKSDTGLSDRWLSRKLNELSSYGLIEHRQGKYHLKNPTEIIEADPVFAKYLQSRASLQAKARLIAEEIRKNERVVAVILFGSLARGRATEESDIDLLIVTENEMEKQLNGAVYDLMFKYDVPVEAVFWTYDDFITNLQAKTTLTLGLLEGYQVLYDRGGVEGLLSIKKKEFLDSWIYDEGVDTWIQRKLFPIS